VLTVRGRRYTVDARPVKPALGFRFIGDGAQPRPPAGGGGRISARPGRPHKIPPGGCDIYEGAQGAQYLCCKSADGTSINCYKITGGHQDPWGPPLP
jgi:hypothetical protein